MIGKIRKGDIVVVDLPVEMNYCLQGEHPCVVISNFLTCESSMSIQIIPLTSQVSSKNKQNSKQSSHIFISRGTGNLRSDSLALCEQIITCDKSRIMYAIGKLPMQVIKQIDKGITFQLNLNRNFNIEFALKLVKNIKELDILTVDDNTYNGLKHNLIQNLKEYCETYHIDYNRLFD